MKKYINFNTEKRKNAAQIDDQFFLWKNNVKFAKKNQCEIGN